MAAMMRVVNVRRDVAMTRRSIGTEVYMGSGAHGCRAKINPAHE